MNTTIQTEMASTAESLPEMEKFCYDCAYNHPAFVYGVIYFNMYITPIIMLFGIIGNIMTLIVLRSRYYSSSPTCVGLSALTVADIGVILARGIHHWLDKAYNIDILLHSRFNCKSMVYIVFVIEQLSGMLIMITTLERLIAVWFPLKIRDWVTKKRMTIICITVSILLAAAFAPVIKDTDIQTIFAGFVFCGWTTVAYMEAYWWLDMSLTCFVQIPIVLCCNMLILNMLVRNAKKQKDEDMHVAKRKLNNSTVAMLIGVGILFVLTTAPMKVFFLGLRFNIWYDNALASPAFYANLVAITNLLQVLPILGSSLNIVAYMMTGSRFRISAKSMFCGICGTKGQPNTKTELTAIPSVKKSGPAQAI